MSKLSQHAQKALLLQAKRTRLITLYKLIRDDEKQEALKLVCELGQEVRREITAHDSRKHVNTKKM